MCRCVRSLQTTMFQASSMLKAAVASSNTQSTRQQLSVSEVGGECEQSPTPSPDDDDALSDAVIAMFVDKVSHTAPNTHATPPPKLACLMPSLWCAARLPGCLYVFVCAAVLCRCVEVFDTFGCGSSGLISFDVVLHHIKTVNPAVDVWDLFGRSMLKETRRDSRAASNSHSHNNSHTAAHSSKKQTTSSSLSSTTVDAINHR